MFTIKQNDTAPAIRATLKDASNNDVNLTGATVKFHMKTESGVVVVDDTATVENANTGSVSYSWSTGDTETYGPHMGEFQVTYSDSSIETFPNKGYIKIRIDREIT